MSVASRMPLVMPSSANGYFSPPGLSACVLSDFGGLGSGNGATLLLNGHMDTVGAGEMQQPHQPRIQDGRLYGRGAYDMKGGLAACMWAAAEAAQRRLGGDVIVQAVV